MSWRPTPKAQEIIARKFAGDSWVDCAMKDLRPGDIFRAVSPNGDVIHPVTGEPDGESVSMVVDYPVKNYNNQIGSLLGEQGYGVPIDIYPSMDELKRKGLS